MTHLLIIENSDQDRHGIDTVLMIVPEEWSRDIATEETDGILRNPQIRDIVHLPDIDFQRLIDLGDYRPFTG